MEMVCKKTYKQKCLQSNSIIEKLIAFNDPELYNAFGFGLATYLAGIRNNGPKFYGNLFVLRAHFRDDTYESGDFLQKNPLEGQLEVFRIPIQAMIDKNKYLETTKLYRYLLEHFDHLYVYDMSCRSTFDDTDIELKNKSIVKRVNQSPNTYIREREPNPFRKIYSIGKPTMPMYKNGFHKINYAYYKDQDQYYEGEIKNNKKHGVGTLLTNSGSVKFIGNFENNLLNGYAELYHLDENGEFKLNAKGIFKNDTLNQCQCMTSGIQCKNLLNINIEDEINKLNERSRR